MILVRQWGSKSIIRRETYCTFGADDAEILRFVERPLVRRIILATWSYIFWCKFEEFKERKKQQTKVAPLVVPRFFPERKGEREKKKFSARGAACYISLMQYQMAAVIAPRSVVFFRRTTPETYQPDSIQRSISAPRSEAVRVLRTMNP